MPDPSTIPALAPAAAPQGGATSPSSNTPISAPPNTNPSRYISNINAASLEYGKDYKQNKATGVPIAPEIV